MTCILLFLGMFLLPNTNSLTWPYFKHFCSFDSMILSRSGWCMQKSCQKKWRRRLRSRSVLYCLFSINLCLLIMLKPKFFDFYCPRLKRCPQSKIEKKIIYDSSICLYSRNLMKIKLAQSKVIENFSHRRQHSNPEVASNRSIGKGIVFQSQYDSIQNYFSLLHHIFGRSSNVKNILRSVAAKQDYCDPNLELQIKDIRGQKQDGIDHSSKTIVSKPSPKRLLQFSNTRFDVQRPKWKESILRRKNNGSHGQIVKGKPKDRYSSLLHRACLTQTKPSEPEAKKVEKYTYDNFIPMGSMLTEYSKNVISFKSIDSESQEYKRKLKTSTKGRKSKKYLLIHHQRKSKLDGRKLAQQQIMSRTCLPLKISEDMAKEGSKLRKRLTSTPYRYKSRLSTPCPWEYTSQP